MYYAQKHKELTGLSSSLQSEIPQLYFDVDRDKVKMLGVPLADVFSTMKAYTGSVYVNDFNMFNRIYKVYIQAEAPYREHKDNINLFFVKAKDGVMVPLTSLGNASYTTGPGSIKRFNMFTTAVIRGSAAQGYSSGQAMEIMEQIARNHLPDNIGLEWSGLSYQERRREDRRVLCLRWYSFSYSSFWLRNMKVDGAYRCIAFTAGCRFGCLSGRCDMRIGE